MSITVNHTGLTSKPKDLRSISHENERFHLVHHPLPKSVPVEYLPFCVHDRCRVIFIQSIHVTLQSTKGERSASRDILTQNQYVSSGLFLPCQSVSPFWPTCPHRTVNCQHSRGWQRSRSDLPHGGPLEPPHDS
ncbi:hypothetical protein TNCV_4895131 [Trichonephila clavipes]|nr:hypothetical protein TNCV_4895131 [Trichonephila clavipes]